MNGAKRGRQMEVTPDWRDQPPAANHLKQAEGLLRANRLEEAKVEALVSIARTLAELHWLLADVIGSGEVVITGESAGKGGDA